MAGSSVIPGAPSPRQSIGNFSGPTNERVGTEAEIAECAKIMLGAFRLADADDPDIYVGHIRRVLSQYPLWVSKRAASRVPDELKWLPAPQEVRQICEAIYAPTLRDQRRQAVFDETLGSRGLPKLEEPRQTYEQFCAEMARRGMPVRKQDRNSEEFDVEAFKTKHDISDDMWNSTPEGDCKFKKLER